MSDPAADASQSEQTRSIITAPSVPPSVLVSPAPLNLPSPPESIQIPPKNIPIAPPLPPPLPSTRAIIRSSQSTAKPPKLPSGLSSNLANNSTSADKARYAQCYRNPSEPQFSPCFLFFYGTLMDPEVLQTVAGLPSPPFVVSGCVTRGFSLKMWGIYPTLIRQPADAATNKIQGVVWKWESEAQFRRLAEYETSAYTSCQCEVETAEGVLGDCRTFCWAGERGSRELEDGMFDLERYRRYFKKSVVRGL